MGNDRKNAVTGRLVGTKRIAVHALFAGDDSGVPVVMIHGNASSSEFWRETMEALPAGFRGIAPDLRGYGDTEDALIDATRGLKDWAEDVLALLDALGVDGFHAAGHSLGGMLLFTLAGLAGPRVLSMTMVAPGSPYGFGGTKGEDGTPCWPDFAGSGGGLVNPDFARLMGEKDRGSDNPQASPRVVLNSFYWKPPFKPANEESLLTSLLSEKVGPERYPGDMTPSPNWPNVAPGKYGPLNAASPKYVGDSVERFVGTSAPVLWIRGADDQIVGDFSLFDIGTLGKLGAVPGWPGEEAFPPQPMLAQTRSVLERRKARAGGPYSEIVIPDCGHTPFVEKADQFRAAFFGFLVGAP
ncbi:MAG: alpha/beta hydrolase [Spirochaetes bacterium]|nr:alpha/beta hydrolase [Spirochaetota bacterium]